MARSRNIKPGYYANEDLAECTIWARYIYPGLWMLADREGRLEDRPKRIKGELLRFDDQDAESLLCELATRGFIRRYEVQGVRYIQIVRFADHQTPHYTEKPSVIPPPDSGSDHPIKSQSPGSDDDKKADQLPEDSKKKQRGRGCQNPLIPDSLIPDSGFIPEPDGSGAAAAPPPPPEPRGGDSRNDPEPKAMTAKEVVFTVGLAVLGDKARTLLGKLSATHGDDLLADVLRECAKEQPVDPRSWVVATCAARESAKVTAAQQRFRSGDRGARMSPQDYIDSVDPKPQWALDAGFSNRFEAESDRCYEHNAHQFRDGKRVEGTA